MTAVPDLLRRLRGSVRMLSSDASRQIDYLERASPQAKFPLLADDIITEFGCWHEHATLSSDDARLSAKSVSDLAALAIALSKVESDPEQWTAQALATSPHWTEIRERAGIALASLDQP
jgi:hypothetical protein